MSVIHHVAPLLTALFRAALQASWQGALAIVLVLIVRRVLGARVPARWHYLLWFLVLVRLLAPTSVLPHSPTSLENIHAVAQPFGPQPLPSADQGAPGGITVAMLPALPASPHVASPRPPSAAVPAVARHAWSWQAFAALAWLAGALSLAFWLVVCSLNLRQRVRQETVPADANLVALWQACCRRWLRRPTPQILTADWVHSPALVGAWQPTLLLPRQMADSFSAQDWEHVFAHEIAHLRWRDHWTQLLLLAAWCVHWFNPVVWLGLRRLRADRELAADDWVLRHLQGDRALAYGETLFKTLSQRSPRLVFQPGVVGISEDGAQMKQRLRRIAAFLPQRRIVGSLVGFAVVLALGTVVLGQSSPAPSASPSPKEAVTPRPAVTPAVLSVESIAAEAQKFSDDLLTAARTGDAATVASLLNASFSSHPAQFSESAATAMLNDLVRQRELKAFTTLHDQLKQTSYGRDWKLDDELLASLVKDRRTDFLDALLARRLNPDRLKNLAAAADAPTGAWITRRVTDVARQRADVEALEKAAEDGDVPAVERLVDAGADVNGFGKDNNTPLLHAVFKNRLEAAQFLLDHGAQVDKARYPGSIYTPLCLVNSVPMAELLKNNGANVHANLAENVSILTYVAKFANSQVVEWFLQQGLNPKMVGDEDENLLFGLKDGQTAELLLKAGVDPNHLDKRGRPPLFSARSAEVARALIDHGARASGFKEPLLPQLAQTGSAGALEAVIQAGADHDPATLQQALFGAVFADDGEAVKILVAHGAKPNEPSAIGPSEDDKMWPLTTCTIDGQLKAAKALLEAGADPNGGKKPGWLLINAMLNGQKEVARLLHDAGARNVSDLAYAVFMRDAAKIKTQLASAPTYAENPAFWDYVLQSAAQSGDVDTVREALAKGVPARPNDANDSYALAAFNGQDEALATLLATRRPGDDPAVLREALWEAVFGSHPDKEQPTVEHFEKCVRMLLDAGAPINGGKFPLVQSAAFTRYPGGNPTVMEMLVRAGADPNPVVSPEGQPVQRLLELVQEACAKGQCSIPVAEAIVRLNQPTTASPTPAPAESSQAPSPAATPVEPTKKPSATSVPLSADVAVQQLADGILAAARDGDRKKVAELLHPTGPQALYLGRSNAAQILDDLLRRREITAFTVLFDASQRSNFAKDWQVSDTLLAGLVKDGRTDFLDLLLAGGLDPAKLGEQAKSADQSTAGWITRRVVEETRRRTDIEALELASDYGDLTAMSRLVDAGADVNGVGKDHNTPLLRAVFKNRLDAAQWLLDHGAQVDKPRFPGWDYTPLCLVNSVAMAELLKKNGANVHAKLYSNDTSILTYVVSFAPSDVVEWFLRQGLDPKMSGDGGEPNLLFELKDGRTATLLLEAGVNPNQVDKDGRTPLSKTRSGEVAQVLIDHGAKVTGLSESLVPDLVQFGSAEAIEAVLKAGADQDESTLQAALADVDRMDIRDYPEKDAMRRVLIKHGATAGPIQPTPAPSISCRATVSLADGTFADFSTVEVHHSESYGPDGGGGRSWSFNNADAGGSVNLNIQQGATSASYAAVKKGYATVYAGPFMPPTKEQVEGIHFVLTKGFSATIVTVDEAGRPIVGARLESYYPGLPMTKLAETTTDASGSSTIEHIGEAPVNVRVLADGFQADEVTGLHLDPVHPYRWTLTTARPLHGKVVAAATGKPISGAVIKLGGVRGPHNESHSDPKEAHVLTTTDEQGDFVLGSVRPDSHYYLFVEAPGYGGAYLRGVALSEGNTNVALGPELMIRGKIIHAPPSVVHMGKVHLQYGQTFRVGENSGGARYITLDLKPINGEAEFAVGPFYKVYGESFDPKKANSWNSDKKPICIYVDTWGSADFSINELPISDFVFDLAKQSDLRSGPAKTEDGSKPAEDSAGTPSK